MAEKKKSTSAAADRLPGGRAKKGAIVESVTGAAPDLGTSAKARVDAKPLAATTPMVESNPVKAVLDGKPSRAAAKAVAAPTAEKSPAKVAKAAAKPAPLAEPVAAKPADTKVAVTAKPAEGTVVAPAARRTPTRGEIAARAHEIYRQRGGTAFDNWIQAERELGG